MIYQQLINGLMLGASYSLIAIGYTLIFGVLKLLYFAHGEVFMVGAFVGLYLVIYGGANIYVALLGAMIICALLGVIAVYVVGPPGAQGSPAGAADQHHRPHHRPAESRGLYLRRPAGGVSGDHQAGALSLSGRSPSARCRFSSWRWPSALMVVLWLFIEHSKMGRAIRATAENHETAALLGVDVNRVVLVTFMIGSGIAGVAGVLDGIKNSGISPFMGLGAAVKGLIVMLLGGLGNVPGAMVAGLLLGMIEILSAAYIGTTERDFFSFLILILILLYRPTGLFGTRTRGRKVAVADVRRSDRRLHPIAADFRRHQCHCRLQLLLRRSRPGRCRSARPASWRSAPMPRRS